MEDTRKKGNNAEDIAVKFISEKGYRLVKRNFHFGRTGEIDIIAYDSDVLVFIEIRSKYNEDYGDPLSSITPAKIKKIRKTAEGFLYINKINDVEIRFDVITIDFSKSSPVLEHIPFAF